MADHVPSCGGSAVAAGPALGSQPLPAGVVQVLESTRDLLIVVDREWRFVYLNRQALARAAEPLESLRGQSVWGKDPDLFGPAAETHYRHALAAQLPLHFEIAGDAAGNAYEVYVHPSPEGLTIYGRDFSKRYHVEHALRETESLFRTFMDNSPALAWMKDSEFRFLYFNRVTEEVTRQRGVAYAGRTDFDLWPLEVAAKLRAGDRAALAEGRTIQIIESTPGPDGQMRHWQVCKFPFTDGAGRRLVGGMAVEVTEQWRAAERLQALSRRLLEVQEQERRSLARELHDEVGHLLTSLHLTLESVKQGTPSAARHGLEQAQGLVRDLMGQVRELSLRLRPSILDELGLLPALAWHVGRFTQQTGIRVLFLRPEHDMPLPAKVATAAYRIVQEALTNVARHADVQAAEVRVAFDETLLHLEIKDQGAGFDPALIRGTAGLSGMQERAALLGGRLVMDSKVGRGTVVTAELPIQGGGKSG